MGMIDDVVLDKDVLARTIFDTRLACACFHAYSVVAGIYSVVYDEYVPATADVYGVAILCIPWAAHLDVVYDDVAATSWNDVELG